MVKRLSDLVKEQDMIVHTLSHYPDANSSIKMEVGIEDCLHIEFEYNKSKLVKHCVYCEFTYVFHGTYEGMDIAPFMSAVRRQGYI